MYHDIFLKFANEFEANSVLFNSAGSPLYHAIDIIGIANSSKSEKKMIHLHDDIYEEIDYYAPLEGYLVNVRHNAEMPELEQWAISTPITPIRFWA
jgi:hypothetical protein